MSIFFVQSWTWQKSVDSETTHDFYTPERIIGHKPGHNEFDTEKVDANFSDILRSNRGRICF